METQKSFRCRPASVPSARHYVVDTLLRAGCDDSLIDRAALLVSELATSAAVHALGAFTVRVRVDAAVRVEVSDRLPSMPAAPDRTGDPKLSLYLLDAIAASWGWETVDEGKTVWCELR